MTSLLEICAARPTLEWLSKKWKCKISLTNGHHLVVMTDYSSATRINWDTKQVLKYWGDVLNHSNQAAKTVADAFNRKISEGARRITATQEISQDLLDALTTNQANEACRHLEELSIKVISFGRRSCQIWAPFLRLVVEYMKERGWFSGP